jgi:hypothetical protein
MELNPTFKHYNRARRAVSKIDHVRLILAIVTVGN